MVKKVLIMKVGIPAITRCIIFPSVYLRAEGEKRFKCVLTLLRGNYPLDIFFKSYPHPSSEALCKYAVNHFGKIFSSDLEQQDETLMDKEIQNYKIAFQASESFQEFLKDKCKNSKHNKRHLYY